MKEGAIALGKVRGYCYLIFLFDILILFHSEIAGFFGTTDKKDSVWFYSDNLVSGSA